MNPCSTSREDILETALRLAEGENLSGLNIREIAKACNVSVGTIYNYFPAKSDLIIALIERVWQHVFHAIVCSGASSGFPDSVSRLFESARAGIASYPAFFTTHALNLSRDSERLKGRAVMAKYQAHIQNGLIDALTNDPDVRADAFDDLFTKERFIRFVFSAVLSELVRGGDSCETLLLVIRRLIY